jgi:lysine-N-methylase
VLLDRQDYARLRAALAGSRRERERFERGCARTPGASAADPGYAALRRAPDGACLFLDPGGLCSVQARHGAAALPTVCVTYPRVVTRVAGLLSVTDALSCPEAARLCLSAADALAIETADPQPLERLRVRHRVAEAASDPLVRAFPAVRDAFLGLLARGEYPAASRLYSTIRLARRLDAARRGPDGASDGWIRATIADATAPTALDRLHRECRAVTAPGSLPFELVEDVLASLLRQQHATRLQALVRDAWGGGDGRGAAGAAARAAYARVRRAWQSAFPERIAVITANYAGNCWLRDPFTLAPDLETHGLGVLARVAAVRYLLFGNRRLRAVTAPDRAAPAHAEALDRAAVEVVYTFSRAVEHGEGMRELIHGFVAERRVRGRRRAVELAAF